MVINKKATEKQKFVEVLFVGTVFVGTMFVISSNDLVTASLISSNVMPQSSIILTKYLSFLQLHVAQLQI